MINKDKNKAFSALITCLIAGTLAAIAILVIKFGTNSKINMHEKQSLDSCGILIGQSIIKTNNIEEFCTNANQTSCNNDFFSAETSFSCEESGLECDSNNNCKRKFIVTSSYNTESGVINKSVKMLINEEVHEPEIIDAAVIFLLDYSGSMRNNRIRQLKNAFNEFVSRNYDLNYAVVLYNSDIIDYTDISKGLNHDQSAMAAVNNNRIGGGTNFVRPLEKALELINDSNHQSYFIILVSDGSPNEGQSPSERFVQNSIRSIDQSFCILSTFQDPCITIYTLGVDNANQGVLRSLSGNALDNDANNYSFGIDANQTVTAFEAIIAEIVCRIGPITSDESFYLFDGQNPLIKGEDYIYDPITRIAKVYDIEPNNYCQSIIENNNNLTLRWGNPIVQVNE